MVTNRVSAFKTPWEETLRGQHDLVTRGLVRYVGCSNLPAWYEARAEGIRQLRGYAPFISAQIYYSLLGAPRLEQVATNLEAADLSLSADELATLDAPSPLCPDPRWIDHRFRR